MTVAERIREAPPRSWLFVPALRAPEWLPKAVSSGADAIIVDLEDATAAGQKDRARETVRALPLAPVGPPWIFVRANAAPAERLQADLGAAVAAGAAGVVLPKPSRAADVARPVAMLGAHERGGAPLAMLLMIETARAVLNALEIAEADPRVAGLGFGAGDLAADMGFTRSRDLAEMTTARSLVVLAAAAAGVPAYDTPWVDVKDPVGAGNEAARARQLGFGGKLVIHPSHVAPVNAAFAPSADEVDRSRRVLAAFDSATAAGTGIATVDGRMIDMPDVLAARRTLARAGQGTEAT
ncbi:CoA ester lyase [soil metagenome]